MDLFSLLIPVANIEISNQSRILSKPQEHCGLLSKTSKIGMDVFPTLKKGLELEQHRGRDTAGVAVFNRDGGLTVHKGQGKVTDVFSDTFDYVSHNLDGEVGIGHVRYGTSGGDKKDDLAGAQPMIAEWKGRQVVVAFNGNLPDSERNKLRARTPVDLIKNGDFDTEDIVNAIASAKGDTWEEKIKNGMQGVQYAYALTILTDSGENFGLSGPSGTWPLWLGETREEYLLASESRVDQINRGEKVNWQEVKPGELVKITPEGVEKKQLFESKRRFRCTLHDMYGAKPDSLMTEEGKTYGDFRYEVGTVLAREHAINADIYVGVPNSGIPFAEGYAAALGRESTQVIIKNEDTKSFIGQNSAAIQDVIERSLQIPHPEDVKGKHVVVIDDSVIRGNSSGGDVLGVPFDDPRRKLMGYVGMLRAAGAAGVDVLSAMPRFKDGCDGGYAILQKQLLGLRKDLITMQKVTSGRFELADEGRLELTDKDIAHLIGADSFASMSIEGVKDAYETITGVRETACLACAGEPHPITLMEGTESWIKPQEISKIPARELQLVS